MSDIYHIEICRLGAGLCNQMFAVISGVLLASISQKHRLVIDGFQDHYSAYSFSDISDILDLEKISEYTSKTYGVTLLDANHIQEDISQVRLIYSFEWIANIDKVKFDDVLRNIHFNQRFVTMASNFTRTLDLAAKINVFHLRIEDDSFPHFCKYNNITSEEFKKKLTTKYIDIITTNVKKSDINIILSYSTDNEVIQFMKENGYTYLFNEKHPSIGREQNAIVDTIVSAACNNVFIGNFNIQNTSGSSFTYFVMKRLNEGVKCVLVDLMEIDTPESVHMTPV